MSSKSTGTLAIIGGGNMGAALAQGLVSSGRVDRARLAIVEVSAERRAVLAEMFPGSAIVASIDHCDASVIAVKPPDAAAAAAAAVAAGAKRVLSIAAGVTLATLQAAVDAVASSDDASRVAVIRSMPNTPSLVGQGASAIAGGVDTTVADRDWARDILGAVGLVVEVPESDLDAITGVTGSGPAYLFLVAEALIDAAVDVGLDRDQAAGLVRQLFVGSAALLAQGDEPKVLRERVTSPQGTTAAGIAVLQTEGVPDAFRAAVRAAVERSRELGRS
ncbi:MAG: pyrroline-5-carboxylate reductase [Ilumatobacteraceae bacterium]